MTPRRLSFDHDTAMRRHYFDDDLLGSHVVAALSAVIPAGERFVASAVRRYRDELDGDLRRQANGFIGQELLHQREHDRFNQTLAGLGYPVGPIDRASQVTFAMASRLPRRFQVSMAAAIEHWTAVIVEHVLSSGDLEYRWDLPETTRAFLAWHGVEELEHRAVAFDAMQQLGAGEAERIIAMRVVVAMLSPAVLGGILVSLATDSDSRRPWMVLRSLDRARRSSVARWSFVRDLLSWNRPGFHPDERDIGPLLGEWQARLGASVVG